jgi:hypothetical protein
MKHAPSGLGPSVALVLAGVVVALLLNAAFTAWSVNTSQHRWCQTLTLLNTSARRRPPTGTYGKALVRDFRDLHASLGCG